MSVWKDEADFMHDIESVSEFFISGDHNKPANKFVFKSKKDNKLNTPWYDSDSDEDLDFNAFGRGRNPTDKTKDPGAEPNHLEVMKEIQMQVRSTVGNRYNNEVLESYYNVYRDDPNTVDDSPSQAPKELSISYAKEQKLKNSSSTEPKKSIAENIKQTASKLATDNKVNSSTASPSSSTSCSPKRDYKSRGNSKKRYDSRNYRKNNTVENNIGYRFPFSPNKNQMNVNSKRDFPPL